ncbi:uncharacterized protein LOC118180201 [Stegodyphus dumicola]|uniref:uncharacterized protein LOC118180201 n=1 Tax=Stegodyphus dumicola TaxID=202533 RepID=UPI0015ADD39A|nr:uncharacterized protein LOC118180201 [Stegodyphus dumicola]
MADAYNSESFNSYDDSYSLPPEYDARCLHVHNIPAEFTREDFAKIMMQGGIKIEKVYLHAPKEGQQFVYGFVVYATHMDAQRIKNSLNGKAPFNFKIKYARKKKNTRDDKEAKMKSKVEKLRSILTTCKKSTDFVPKKKTYNTFPSHPSAKSGEHKDDSNKDANSNTLPKFKKDLDFRTKKVHNSVSVECDQNGRKAVQDRIQRNKFNSSKVAGYLSRPPGLIDNPFFWCLFCNTAIGKLSCAVCKKPYCSQICQQKDWKKHKSTCQPL